MKSLQHSLMEEILAVDDISFPSFTTTDRNNYSEYFDIDAEPKHLITKKNKAYTKSRDIPSIADLEDQILRMRANAHKSQVKTPSQVLFSNCESQKKKIKTQASENCSHTIENKSNSQKKRRSSLDYSVYERSTQHQSRLNQWKKQKVYEKESIEKSNYTYKPQMSEGSREIARKIDRQTLYRKQKQNKQRKKESIKKQEERKALQQCIFTPNLKKGRKSSKDIKSVEVTEFGKKNNPSVFESLYQESKIREMKQKQKQIQTIKSMILKPKVDPISQQIINGLSFEQRTKIYEKRKVEKEMMRKQQCQKQNSTLYRPKINSYCVSRNPQMSIGEHLYSQAKKTAKKQVEQKKGSKVNKKSQKVYEERKMVAFYQIFKLLDDDEDGIICSQSMNMQMLPRQIVKIIYPLIDELDAMDVQLHEHQFIDSLHNLFQTLSIHERNIILGFTSTPKPQQQPSFRPKINARSQQIAEEIHRSSLDISQFCTIREAEREKQLQTQRIEKSKRQMEKCTFHPQIIRRFRY